MNRKYKHFRFGLVAIPLVMGIGGGALGGMAAGALGMGAVGGAMLSGIGFMGGSMLGSMLFPQKNKVSMPKVGSYPVQSSCKGIPVPKIYGTCRVAGNIIWMGPTQTITTKHTEGGGGMS